MHLLNQYPSKHLSPQSCHHLLPDSTHVCNIDNSENWLHTVQDRNLCQQFPQRLWSSPYEYLKKSPYNSSKHESWNILKIKDLH